MALFYIFELNSKYKTMYLSTKWALNIATLLCVATFQSSSAGICVLFFFYKLHMCRITASWNRLFLIWKEEGESELFVSFNLLLYHISVWSCVTQIGGYNEYTSRKEITILMDHFQRWSYRKQKKNPHYLTLSVCNISDKYFNLASLSISFLCILPPCYF